MINSSVFQGNLTRDPEYKDLPSGAKVCNIRLASNQKFTDKSGNQREETTFIGVQVYGRQATNCHQFLHKGSQVIVQGRLQSRDYQTKDGQKRVDIFILADTVQFLDGKPQQSNRFPETQQQSQRGYSAADRPDPRPPVPEDDKFDDIPW